MVKGILFAHGEMAEGMVDAVRRITGVGEEVLAPLSNDGLGRDDLLRAIEDLAGDAPVIVFTDLLAGSCAAAATISCTKRADRAVICGVNLPMLLDFVFHSDMPLPALVERILDKGREGMRALRAPA
jgi:mannose/fructose-specific phosphotransferase system component IIA